MMHQKFKLLTSRSSDFYDKNRYQCIDARMIESIICQTAQKEIKKIKKLIRI